MLAHELLTGRSPWSSLSDKAVIRREISGLPVAPPPGLSRAAGSLVCGLLRPAVARRLGTRADAELEAHPFFAGVDWRALAAGGGGAVPGLPLEGAAGPAGGCVGASDRADALAAYILRGLRTGARPKAPGEEEEEEEEGAWFLGLARVAAHPAVAPGVLDAAAAAVAAEAETAAPAPRSPGKPLLAVGGGYAV